MKRLTQPVRGLENRLSYAELFFSKPSQYGCFVPSPTYRLIASRASPSKRSGVASSARISPESSPCKARCLPSCFNSAAIHFSSPDKGVLYLQNLLLQSSQHIHSCTEYRTSCSIARQPWNELLLGIPNESRRSSACL